MTECDAKLEGVVRTGLALSFAVVTGARVAEDVSPEGGGVEDGRMDGGRVDGGGTEDGREDPEAAWRPFWVPNTPSAQSQTGLVSAQCCVSGSWIARTGFGGSNHILKLVGCARQGDAALHGGVQVGLPAALAGNVGYGAADCCYAVQEAY